MLDHDALQAAIQAACDRWPAWSRGDAVRVVESIASTNSALMALAHDAARPARALLGARTQTAGRGRLGRRWRDEAGASFIASFGFALPVPLNALAGYALGCGIATRAALASTGVHVGLKWPNDVVTVESRPRKLGGLLLEAHAVDAGTWTVIGIGLNVRPSEVTRSLDAADAASLSQRDVDPNMLAARLIVELETMTEQFLLRGFAAFRAEFDAAHVHHGREVVLQQEGRVIAAGRFAGVGPHGEALVLDANGATRSHHVGDLSLRPAFTAEVT